MKKKTVSTISRGAVLAVLVGIFSFAVTETAEAHHRKNGVVVRHRVHRTVRANPRPVVVRYVPGQHRDCHVRSGYYYNPSFGYHRHHRHPGGIHFGVHLVF